MSMIAVARRPDRVRVSGMWAIIESLLEACMSVIWKCELSFFYGSLLIVLLIAETGIMMNESL
jgi:hypothetical protein